MSEEIGEVKKPFPWVFTVIVVGGMGLLFVFSLLPLLSSPKYWLPIWKDAWRSTGTIALENWAFTALAFLFSLLFIKVFRGKSDMKDWLSDGALALTTTTCAAVVYFSAQFFVVLPASRGLNQDEKVAALAKSNEVLRAANESLEKDNPAIRKRQLEKAQAKTAEQIETIEKTTTLLVKAITNVNPQRAALEAIANQPVEIPKIKSDGQQINLDEARVLARALNEKKRQESAKSKLSQADQVGLDEAVFVGARPYIDYYVKHFEQTLKELAEQNSDKLLSTYTNTGSYPPSNATITMEKNSQWIFHVHVFRKDGLGYGAFNWMITSPNFAPYFKCTFSGTNYSYGFYEGVGSDIAHGSGEIKSIGTTNLPLAFTYLIGYQESSYPLTNFGILKP